MKIDGAELVERLNAALEAWPPPYVLFDRRDGTGDVLPAGRPGAVFEGLPISVAGAIVAMSREIYRGGSR